MLATNGILTKTPKSGQNRENVQYIPLLLYFKCFFATKTVQLNEYSVEMFIIILCT